MALTEVPPCRALDRDPSGLIQGGRQLFVGPVRPIEPTALGAVLHPPLDRRRQRLGHPTRLARGPVDLEARPASFMIQREPAPHGGAMHAQILGDGPTLTAPARHQHRLAPVAEASVGGRLENVFEVRLFRCRQPNPLHRFCLPLMRHLTRGYLKKDVRSSGVCMSIQRPVAHHTPQSHASLQTSFPPGSAS